MRQRQIEGLVLPYSPSTRCEFRPTSPTVRAAEESNRPRPMRPNIGLLLPGREVFSRPKASAARGFVTDSNGEMAGGVRRGLPREQPPGFAILRALVGSPRLEGDGAARHRNAILFWHHAVHGNDAILGGQPTVDITS